MGTDRSHPLLSFSPGGRLSSVHKRWIAGFCAFWLFIALLELGQDYIGSRLNGHTFSMAESLYYKLFWLLFIPLTPALYYGFSWAGRSCPETVNSFIKAVLALLAAAIHLLLFSFILFGISNLMHESPLTLLTLIYEKLSTRLYLALTIYAALTGLYIYLGRRDGNPAGAGKPFPKTLTVKKGRTSVIVDVSDIKWISSDGPYLDIHAKGQKHVVLHTLKHIIRELPDNFRRIHKSTIVNADKIAELKSRGNGDYDVLMDDGKVLRLSRTYAATLKQLL